MAGIGLLIAWGLLLRAPWLDRPLLEGAAGKQAHTAMVARNFHRGIGTFSRPIVDDIGSPGYFVKEVPLLALLAAKGVAWSGLEPELLLRLLGTVAWIAAAVLLLCFLRHSLGPSGALWAALWFLTSPIGLVYAPTAMNDSLAVAVALGGLLAVDGWRRAPGLAKAIPAAFLAGAALLAKPHSAFWLGPAAAWLCLARGESERPRWGGLLSLCAMTAAAMGLAGLWYAHGASVHQTYPVAGATVPQGWVAPSLWLRPDLYAELGRQTIQMVFTPIGLVIALAGIARGPKFDLAQGALLAWGAGVLLQSIFFAPRAFDSLARGTEYYQLPLAATAGLLVARGIGACAEPFRSPRGQRLARFGAAALLVLVAATTAREAARPPERYATVLRDCAQVQEKTRPEDRLVVLADRGGVIQYYCDRKGITFALSGAVHDVVAASSGETSSDELRDALETSDYLYLPFPELLDPSSEFLVQIERHWPEVALDGAHGRLFASPAARLR